MITIRICIIILAAMSELLITIPANAETGWVCSYIADKQFQMMDKFAVDGNELRQQPNDRTDEVEKALTDGLAYQIIRNTSEGIVAIMAEADKKELAPNNFRTDIDGSMILINKKTGGFEKVSTSLAPLNDTPPVTIKGTCITD